MSTNVASIEIPDGMRLHTENTSNILLDANEAFLNPVQEFNRDMSVACISVWSDELNAARERRWRERTEKVSYAGTRKTKRKKTVQRSNGDDGEGEGAGEAETTETGT